jgi:hypothetical protein
MDENNDKKWFFDGLWYLFIGILLIYLIYLVLQKEGFLED